MSVILSYFHFLTEQRLGEEWMREQAEAEARAQAQEQADADADAHVSAEDNENAASAQPSQQEHEGATRDAILKEAELVRLVCFYI